jgi:hypothetical protein
MCLRFDCDVMMETKDWGPLGTYIPYSILIFRASIITLDAMFAILSYISRGWF